MINRRAATTMTASSHRRRAGVYILVLGTSLVITVIGMSALMGIRIESRRAQDSAGFLQARLHAHSAVQMGFHLIATDPNWRQTHSSGAWRIDQLLGRGDYALSGDDPTDAALADSPSDPLILTGVGADGASRYALSVELAPYGPEGMDSLASAVHVAGLLQVNSTLSVDALASSNGSVIVAPTGGIVGNVATVGTVAGGGPVTGTILQGAEAREMPSAVILDSYVSLAAPMSILAVPVSGTFREISGALISPASNPFGVTTSPQGLYVLDCQGQSIRIMDTRVHGSLVILDPGPGSEIVGAIRWDTFDAALPALLVRGSMIFNWSGSLSEVIAGRNFNPVGSPYQTVADADLTDVYPGTMVGLVAVFGDLFVTATEAITGVVLCTGTQMRVDQPLTITHDPALVSTPPPGFERALRPMAVVSGTWKQVVGP